MARAIRRLEFLVGALLLAVIVGLVFIAAIMRFFDRPLIWSVDLAQLLFIWLCFIGAARALRERAHLGVDLFVRFLGGRRRLLLETGMAAVFVAFLGVLAWEGYKLTLLNIERVFGDSGLPYALVTIAVPVGSLLLALAIGVNTVEAWRARGMGLLIFTRAEDPGDVHQEL